MASAAADIDKRSDPLVCGERIEIEIEMHRMRMCRGEATEGSQ
jgi:hypothetical protein